MNSLYAEEKAALLLMALNPPDAENVLAQLDPEQGNRLRSEIQRLGQMPPAQEYQSQVVREFDGFLEQIQTRGAVTAPSADTHSGNGKKRLSDSEILLSEEDDAVAALRTADVDKLSQALQTEQPRLVALVVDALDVSQAGEVLKRLPPAIREVVSLQLGRSVKVAPDVLQRIARAVAQKSQQMEEVKPPETEIARYKKMADMLRLLPKQDRLAVVAALDEHDSAVAAGVKEFLYQFEDILRIEDRSMQKVLSEVDSKSLALSIKGAVEGIRDKVMNNLSKRARETLEEEMEFLGNVAPAQIEQAKKALVEVIQKLDQAGDLVMAE